MNKTKKIATAVVSLVLASTMCISIAGCSSTKEPNSLGGSGTEMANGLYQSQDRLMTSADDDGTGGTLTYDEGTTLNLNVGYNTNNNMSISYTSANLSGTVTMPDGVTYTTGSLKPAWQGLSDTLGIGLTDGYTNLSGSAQITTNVSTGALNNYNIITASASTIVTAATSDTDLFLDLSLYLDYMPNYKKFLEDNPIVYMSLTSSTTTGAMYYAPYFDGNDDIEKYEIAQKNWAHRILDDNYKYDSVNKSTDKDIEYTYDSSKSISYATQASNKNISLSSDGKTDSSAYNISGKSTSVSSFMGTTGSWAIDSTDPEDEDKTVTITVSYANVIKELQDSNSDLYKAVSDALPTGTAVQTTSGNIVDIQNQVIDATSGTVTGGELRAILQAYIDACYLDSDGDTYYDTRSDVFNGADAAWDVDLLVGLMRCVVTAGSDNLGTQTDSTYIYGLSGRQNNTQRESDLYSLAGELYGARGFTSRYKFSYIDSNGEWQENREDEYSYEVLDKMNDMVQEGLVNVTSTATANKTSYYNSDADGAKHAESFMIYDYVQTQTANGGYYVMGVGSLGTYESVADDYDFEPIVTPVSKWNDGDDSTEENGDGIVYSYDTDGCKYMRFTESWRSVKDTGFCVPYESVAYDTNKLAATLALIDYLFSNDGQIMMSFGTQSTNGNTAESATADSVTSTDNGWWYGTKVADKSISEVATLVGGQYYINDEYASQYFCYNNELYTGTYYKGKMYPTMTNSNLAFYYGKTVNGVKLNSDNGFGTTGSLSYTNYARYQIGAALPIGNKLQAFEFQCTSDQGINGGNIVAAGLTNGTISHVSQDPLNEKGYWYAEVATTLPFSSTQSSWITTNVQETLDNSVFANSSSITINFYTAIIKYGLGNTSYTFTAISSTTTIPATAAGCIELLNDTYKMNTYESYMQSAWTKLLSYYNNYLV